MIAAPPAPALPGLLDDLQAMCRFVRRGMEHEIRAARRGLGPVEVVLLLDDIRTRRELLTCIEEWLASRGPYGAWTARGADLTDPVTRAELERDLAAIAGTVRRLLRPYVGRPGCRPEWLADTRGTEGGDR